ncbi:hypothetical protein P171DRAFT_444695 [Karstenula rhodostoma CBS 690.94]|uniref:Uncharacterized protein n=1 Tax=Karstenula rhodostoma CBS 690.94 TaxID=1392251 RepID=A0A9P4UAI3_9PLEO|nr:hypothetical protein P171DRAFT_444695 [Karstenula rhodostoma CBS 690.94]
MLTLSYQDEILWQNGLIAKTALLHLPDGPPRILAAELLRVSTGESCEQWPASNDDASSRHVKLFYLAHHVFGLAGTMRGELRREAQRIPGLLTAFQNLSGAVHKALLEVQLELADDIDAALSELDEGQETSTLAVDAASFQHPCSERETRIRLGSMSLSPPHTSAEDDKGVPVDEDADLLDEAATMEISRIAAELNELDETDVKRKCFVEYAVPLRRKGAWLSKSELVPKLALKLWKVSRGMAPATPSAWKWKADVDRQPDTPKKRKPGEDLSEDRNEASTFDSSSGRKRANIGRGAETDVLQDVENACKVTDYRVIPSFDFADGDGAIVDIKQRGVKEPFPHDAPLTSFRRLAWAHRHRNHLQALMIDIKTGWPKREWHKAMGDVFLTRLQCLPPDRIVAIPRDRVEALENMRWGRWRLERHPDTLTSNPGLAPYVVYKEEFAKLIARIMGESVAGANAAVLGDDPDVWQDCKQVPLARLFRFRMGHHETSFLAVWQLFQWIEASSNTRMELHRGPTQPLGGDFAIFLGKARFIIQHKVDSQFQSSWYKPPAFFHFLFWHRHSGKKNTNDAELVVTGHDTSKRHTFSYSDDAAELEAFIRQHAKQAHRELMAQDLSYPAVDGVDDDEPALDETTRRGEHQTFRRMAHRLAISFYDFVNGHESNFSVACIYLNFDQTHISGDVLVVRHAWTEVEKAVFRVHRRAPVEISRVQGPGLLLRFACREFRNRRLHMSHIPLASRGAEMPLTRQAFILVGAPDCAMSTSASMTSNLMFLPSECIDFPDAVHKEWDETDSRDEPTLFSLSMKLSNTQKSERWPKLTKDGVHLFDFWFTPERTMQHLMDMLRSDRPDARVHLIHPEAAPNSTSPSFDLDDYLVEVRSVLRAPLDHGMVRQSDGIIKRTTGLLAAEAARRAGAKTNPKERSPRGAGQRGRRAVRNAGPAVPDKEDEEEEPADWNEDGEN